MKEELLPYPLPPIGEPYKMAWGDIYDFYGNCVEKRMEHGVGNDYNESIDNLYMAWQGFINENFLFLHRKWDDRLPMTVTHNATAVFNRLYGGFGFDAMMRIIRERPDRLGHELDAEFKNWTENTFSKFFDEFCSMNNIHPIQVPEKTMESARDLFDRGMERSVVEDFTGSMEYKIGIELHDGNFYETSAIRLYHDWKFGYLANEMTASIVGLQADMGDFFGTKKRGWIERTFFKSRLERQRRMMVFNIAIYDENSDASAESRRIAKFNLLDVVRFYPPPPGDPVPNPLLA